LLGLGTGYLVSQLSSRDSTLQCYLFQLILSFRMLLHCNTFDIQLWDLRHNHTHSKDPLGCPPELLHLLFSQSYLFHGFHVLIKHRQSLLLGW